MRDILGAKVVTERGYRGVIVVNVNSERQHVACSTLSGTYSLGLTGQRCTASQFEGMVCFVRFRQCRLCMGCIRSSVLVAQVPEVSAGLTGENFSSCVLTDASYRSPLRRFSWFLTTDSQRLKR